MTSTRLSHRGLAAFVVLALASCTVRTHSHVTTGGPAPADPVAPAPTPAPEAKPTNPTVPPAQPAAELVFPQDDFRGKQPAPSGAPGGLKLAPPKRFTLKNGLQVFLVEDHTLPKVEMQVVFEGGGLTNPKGKEGRAGVCANTIGNSTEQLDTVAFAEATADLAAAVTVSATAEQHVVSLSTLTRNLEPSARLWADVIRRPGLRTDDFERNRTQALAGLKQAKGSPSGLANLYRPRVLYGMDHPLARVPSEASLGALTLDDCKAFHKETFLPGGARLWVAGDITQADLTKLLDTLFADWTGKAKAPPAVGGIRPLAGKVFFIDVPGAAQSSVYLMGAGPTRKDPSYFATTVAGNALGGGFSSRINMTIREKKGYAYGARGGFSYLRNFGTFVAYGSIRTDATGQAVLDIYNEIKTMKAGPVSDEEFGREKNQLILSLPADFETASDVIGALSALVYFGLPLDYYDTYVAKAERVTKAAVESSAKRFLKPDELRIFVVGDGAVVRADLQKLAQDGSLGGKGAFVELTTDGAIVGAPAAKPPAAPAKPAPQQ